MSFESFKDMRPGLAVFILLALSALAFPSAATAGCLLIGLIAYGFEKAESYLEKKHEADLYDKNFTMLQNQLDEIKKDHVSVMKAADEAKTLLAHTKVATGFIPRSQRI